MSDSFRRTDEIVNSEDELLQLMDCSSWHDFSEMLDMAWYWDDNLLVCCDGSDTVLTLAVQGMAGVTSAFMMDYPFTLSDFWVAIDVCELEYDRRVIVSRLPRAGEHEPESTVALTQLAAFFGGEATEYVDWMPVEADHYEGILGPLECCFAIGNPVESIVGVDFEYVYVMTPDGSVTAHTIIDLEGQFWGKVADEVAATRESVRRSLG
jgi:hypothetical protein